MKQPTESPESPVVATPKRAGPEKRKAFKFNARFTAEACELLDTLSEMHGVSRCDIIEMSVRLMARQSQITTTGGYVPRTKPT